MNSKDQGLTVGELTLAIGTLIIAGLIWSNIVNDKDSEQSLNIEHNLFSLSKSPNVTFL